MKQVVIEDRSVHLDRLSGIKFFAFISAVFFSFPAKQRPQFSSSTRLRDGAAVAAAAVLGFLEETRFAQLNHPIGDRRFSGPTGNFAPPPTGEQRHLGWRTLTSISIGVTSVGKTSPA